MSLNELILILRCMYYTANAQNDKDFEICKKTAEKLIAYFDLTIDFTSLWQYDIDDLIIDVENQYNT